MESASNRFCRLASVLIPYIIRARSSGTPVQGVANRGGHWQAWCFDLRDVESAFLAPTPVSVFFMDSLGGQEMFDKTGVATIMYICALLAQQSHEWLQGVAACTVTDRRCKLAEAFPDPLVCRQAYCERVHAVMVEVSAQQNTKDCGIFAVLFLWDLSHGVPRRHAELTDIDVSKSLRRVTQQRVTKLRKADFSHCLKIWTHTMRTDAATSEEIPYLGAWRPTPRELEDRKMGHVRIGRSNTKGAKMTLCDLAALDDHHDDRDSWVTSTYIASKAELYSHLHNKDLKDPNLNSDVFMTEDKVAMARTI